MTINLQKPDIRELKPKITVFGVGGGGGNAVNNMISGGLEGVEFVVANTDAQALTQSKADKIIQLGVDVTEGLGAGSQPEVGAAAAEECLSEIQDYLAGTHMCFVTAGMGGGTGTGAAPVVARAARELGILTVGVVTKPFQFEGSKRFKTAEAGILELQKNVDTMIVIPNQNLFRVANDKTTFADAFGMADQVLYSGVACITDLMVKEGLINLDFADVRSVMRDMGKAMMGTGEASGEGRAMAAAEAAIANPLLDETSMAGAQGLLISITGGRDMTLFEVDEAATRIREEVDSDANIIVGATFDESLDGIFRVSVVATGIEAASIGAQAHSAGNVTTNAQADAAANAPVRASILSASPFAAKIQARQADEVADEVAGAQTSEAAQTGWQANSGGAENGAPNAARPTPGASQTGAEHSSLHDIDDDFQSELQKELDNPQTRQTGNYNAERYVPPVAQKPAIRPQAAAQAPVTPEHQPPATKENDSFAPIERQLRSGQPGAERADAPQGDAGPMGLLQKIRQGFGARDSHASTNDDFSEEKVESASAQTELKASRDMNVHREADNGVTVNAASSTRSNPMVEQNPFAPKRANREEFTQTRPQNRQINDDDQLEIPAFLRRQAN